MEAAALERQRRLAGLKAVVGDAEEKGNREGEVKREGAKEQEEEPATTATMEEEARRLVEASKSLREQTAEQQLSLADLAPKKANWDLKRDFEGKTAELERQTQAAIAQLFRQRLDAQKD